MRNAGLDEAPAGIKIARKIINSLRYADDTTHGGKWRGTKNPLDEDEEEREKVGLKFNIKKSKIVALGPLTSWQREGKKVETVTNFLFLGFKITADSDCSLEIKRHLLLGRKAMTNLDSSILKRTDIILLTKVHIVKATLFPSRCVWIWEMDHKEGWVLKNCCFWAMVLEKTLESPMDCKEIKPVNPNWKQPWIFIGRTYAEAEIPIISPPDAKTWLIGKDPDAGKDLKARGEGDDRGWDSWMASPTQWTWAWVNSRNWWWKRGLLCCSPGGHKESDTTEQLNWTELKSPLCMGFSRPEY